MLNVRQAGLLVFLATETPDTFLLHKIAGCMWNNYFG